MGATPNARTSNRGRMAGQRLAPAAKERRRNYALRGNRLQIKQEEVKRGCGSQQRELAHAGRWPASLP